ncbi:MAG: thiamine pyrophosphate-dependent enzyme [Bacteroidales bacterium]|nr:thiamine pyrophosphate-dependent enzyme [Bacteroidales bacterium]
MNKEQNYTRYSKNDFKRNEIYDYYLAYLSRQLSIIGRKEVLSGKAKFGIFGDGKEVAQIALANQFNDGDWRSGYYRDQSFMLAAGLFSPECFFIQLYGVTDSELNPGNAGRSFNNHYATPNIDEKGLIIDLSNRKNSAADLSPTAGQMPRALGLGLASKLFRHQYYNEYSKGLSNNGNEVTFVSIGDASTSEGHFFEVLNSAAVKQIPVAITVFDDGYGISVEKKVQTVKESISEALSGFEKNGRTNGIRIYREKGWNYPGLNAMFEKGIKECREEHVPVLFHVEELTQPQGHSTSGSHERYKSKERLEWEANHDALLKMREWLLEQKILSIAELEKLEQEVEQEAIEAKKSARKKYQEPILNERDEVLSIIKNKSCVCNAEMQEKVDRYVRNLENINDPIRKDVFSAAKKILRNLCSDCRIEHSLTSELKHWLDTNFVSKYEKYSAHLYSENEGSALNVEPVPPMYGKDAEMVAGREILRDNFDILFDKHPLLLAFGEDVGKIGGVNQTYEGLQEKYGEHRVFDTGIRESSIIGKGIGLALRGFRPIAEIQYFDYLLYALQTLSDDIATLHWRTAGIQSVPIIISTRGHRLEGIWHSGSPLSMVINAIRGIYVCVPRDMTRAAGFYNTLLEGNDPALVIEPLNGYRLREPQPLNKGKFKVPLGIPEILNEGNHVTLVTYGSCVRIAQDAIVQLNEFGISVELIDVQTLLPFDINDIILESLKKTNRILFFDEDVPGGATAFMMQKVLEEQGGFKYLDSSPKTLTAMEHRPAYSTDGDYFSNPNAEDVFETIYDMMHESNPEKYPNIF